MPAIFWGLASAESKLSCRMLTPDEFSVVANSQKQAAHLEIHDKLGRELMASLKLRRAMDNLLEAIRAIHQQPASRTLNAVIQVALLPSTTAEPLAGKVRNLVHDFDVQGWLRRRIKCGMADAGCTAALSMTTGPTIRQYEEDEYNLPRADLGQLTRCAQILAAVGGEVSERMLDQGYIDMLATLSTRQILSSEIRSTALAGVTNLMSTCPGTAKSVALASCNMIKGVRAALGTTRDERGRQIALRFVHSCICGDDASNKQAVMDSNFGTAVGRLLAVPLLPPKERHIVLEIINSLAHVSSGFRKKLIVNDAKLVPNVEKLADPRWLDDFRTDKNIEIKIRKTAGSCVLLLKPMSKELGNFGAIKTELATLKRKAATWARQNHKENTVAGAQQQRQRKTLTSPNAMKTTGSERRRLDPVAIPSSTAPKVTKPPAAPPAPRNEVPLLQHDSPPHRPFCATQRTAPRSNRNKFGGLGPPVME